MACIGEVVQNTSTASTLDQYKAIMSLSGLENVIYYCRNNDCRNHVKYINSEWVKSQDASEVEEIVTNLTQQHIWKEYEFIPKAVSDLSSKIIHLQAQESDLCNQIKNTAVALDTHPDKTKTPSQISDRKSHIVVYSIDESPPNTQHLQHDTDAVGKVFGSIKLFMQSDSWLLLPGQV